MSRIRYVETISKDDEGRVLVDPAGSEWKILKVARLRTKTGRTWMIGLRRVGDGSPRYREEPVRRISKRAWTWQKEPNRRVLRPSSAAPAPTDDDGRRLCKYCDEPIFFVRTEGEGNAMPLDPEPVAAADLAQAGATMALTRGGQVLGSAGIKQAARDDLSLYRSHFATCTRKPERTTS